MSFEWEYWLKLLRSTDFCERWFRCSHCVVHNTPDVIVLSIFCLCVCNCVWRKRRGGGGLVSNWLQSMAIRADRLKELEHTYEQQTDKSTSIHVLRLRADRQTGREVERENTSLGYRHSREREREREREHTHKKSIITEPYPSSTDTEVSQEFRRGD